MAAIVTTGRRTATNLLRTVSALAPDTLRAITASCPGDAGRAGDSPGRWRGYILRHWVSDGPAFVCGEDTLDGHRGKKVYGKARHHDAVRSTMLTHW